MESVDRTVNLQITGVHARDNLTALNKDVILSSLKQQTRVNDTYRSTIAIKQDQESAHKL